jgi:hypothetical protein
MNEQEAIQNITSQGVEATTTMEEWLGKIRSANEVVRRISNRVKTIPEIEEFDERFQERFKKLENEPTFQEHVTGAKSKRLGLVELASLHCFQQQLNVEYIESLVQSAPDPDELEATVKFCLPTLEERQKTKVLTSFNQDNNTFTAVSENRDLRIIGMVQGEDESSKRKFTGFAYVFGLPQVSVVDYKGVLLIKNGYHRAFALLKKGHKFLPCLLLSTDNFQFTGAQRSGFFPIDLIMSDKSPILSDFNTEAAVLVPRRRIRVMATIHAEIQVVPV